MNPNNLIQWFPGHMTKTNRMIKANLSCVDMIMEIVDARVAKSSKNPDIATITEGKPRLIVINKTDLADPKVTKMWTEYYSSQGNNVVVADSRSKSGISTVIPAIKSLMSEKTAQLKAKGMGGKPVRVMVVGIPNAGKSSLINCLAGSRKAKVEDRPGVTRGKQWVSITDTIELLDTPGVLWPKFEHQNDAQKLAFTGAIKDDVVDIQWLACLLLSFLKKDYPELLKSRFKIETLEDDDFELLKSIGKKRGMLISGGEIDVERASIMMLDEFRGGRLGRISLEKPGE